TSANMLSADWPDRLHPTEMSCPSPDGCQFVTMQFGGDPFGSLLLITFTCTCPPMNVNDGPLRCATYWPSPTRRREFVPPSELYWLTGTTVSAGLPFHVYARYALAVGRG